MKIQGMTIQEMLSCMMREAKQYRYPYSTPEEEAQQGKVRQAICECREMTLLRQLIIAIEIEVKRIAGNEDNTCCFESWTAEQTHALTVLTDWRSMVIEQMLQPTEAEVRRLEYLNTQLREACRRLHAEVQERHRLWQKYRSQSKERGAESDGLMWGFLDYRAYQGGDGVVSLPDDAYYGSDFPYMLHLISRLKEAEGVPIETYDEGDYHDEEMADWAVGRLRQPAFHHIPICHAVHSIYEHQDYSIPDLLHMGKFQTKITESYNF